VLLDDASTDKVSPKLCESLASDTVKVVLLDKNLGRSSIRNRGVEELGDVDYILMLDCDDKLSPSYVRLLVDALDQSPGAGLAYGTLHFFGQITGREVDGVWPSREWTRDEMYLDNCIPGPGSMFRREALRQTEGWRPYFNQCGAEDFDISLQVLEKGWLPVFVRPAVFHYRKHSDSSLARKTLVKRQMVEVGILDHHYQGMMAAGVVDDFVARKILPSLVAAIRRADFGFIAAYLPMFRRAPALAARAIGSYYVARIRERIKRLLH
jgi:glycosyltransferase involved in cell wall biosynthesis